MGRTFLGTIEVIITNLADHIVPLPTDFLTQTLVEISRSIHIVAIVEAKKINLHPSGYGSIPINTIFSGMNIHLPAILMFTRGTRF